MCIHDKREDAKIFEDHAVGTFQDSRLVGHVPMELYFLLCEFIEKRTKYLLKSTEEENWKMAELYNVFIM